MKKSKTEKGITLVALIITIVILLILAVVTISSIKNDGILVRADQASFISKIKKYEEELTLYINNKKLETMLSFDKTSLTASKTSDPSITDIIKSMNDQDAEKFIIEEGKLKYIGDNAQEKEWSGELGLQVGKMLKKIYGNSVQDGIPSPEAPIDIQSVGDKTKNLFDISKAENGTVVTASGQNLEGSDRCRSDFIYLTKGTYCFSCLNNIQIGGYIHKYSTPNQTSWISATPTDILTFEGTKTIKTFNLDQDCYVRFVILPVANSGVSLDLDYLKTCKPQLEKGTMATEYEPYGYKIPIKVTNGTEETTKNIYLDEPLRKIGDYVDYIDFENKKVVRNIASQYINTVQYISGDNTKYRKFLTDVSYMPLLDGTGVYSQGYAISNKFARSSVTYANMGLYPNLISSYITTAGLSRIVYTFDDSSIATIADAQELIGYGFGVCYVMAENIEESIELPDITILNDTIITIDTTVQPSKIEK